MNELDSLSVTSLPRVHVLLASYNGLSWIENQINSVLNQSGVDVEISVSDDCSNDGTLEYLEKLCELDSRINLLSSGVKHGSAGRNFFWLIKNANLDRFDYVSFCDQDDIWDKHKLHRAIYCLNNSGAVGYSASVMAFWESGEVKLLQQSDRKMPFDYLFEGAGQGCTFVLRASILVHVQCFMSSNDNLIRDIHYHDWAIYAFVRVNCWDWYFDNVPVMRYRQHAANDTGARSGLSSIIKRYRLIRSGWYKGQVVNIFNLCNAAKCDTLFFEPYVYFLIDPVRDFMSSLLLLIFILRKTRRRVIDRLVLAVSVCLCWI